jgi:hypothetical protein
MVDQNKLSQLGNCLSASILTNEEEQKLRRQNELAKHPRFHDEIKSELR